jgi:hypothetical protein
MDLEAKITDDVEAKRTPGLENCASQFFGGLVYPRRFPKAPFYREDGAALLTAHMGSSRVMRVTRIAICQNYSTDKQNGTKD